MFAYLNWVSDLQGISPVARLLGLRMSNYASYIGDGFHLGPDDPACRIGLAATLAWIGCGEDEIRAAMRELISEGVKPLRIEGDKIVYTFPHLEEHDSGTPAKPQDYAMSIYVIAAQPGISKIGIAKNPLYRLDNLQAANPTQQLSIAWNYEGPSTVIRRVERQAHAELAALARGREWFDVSSDAAISTVTALLARAGLIK